MATYIFLSAVAVILLVLLGLAFRDPRRLPKPQPDPMCSDERGRRHVTYFPQVRQALQQEDFRFLASSGSRELARRVRRERRMIALTYLACLRQDFLRLWRLARVISSMSPNVGAAQEFARLRLGLGFYLRYELVRFKFALGVAPAPELGSLNEVVSRLAIRLETAMRDLGERAALAGNLASSLDGRGLNTP
jgi:hypothetical protein